MTAAGICGSDRGIYNGTNAAATYPRIIGHEMVGVVDEIGPDVKNLKVGDRVIINQVISCGHCYPCSLGRGNVCDNLKVRGVHVDGGYRECCAGGRLLHPAGFAGGYRRSDDRAYNNRDPVLRKSRT